MDEETGMDAGAASGGLIETVGGWIDIGGPVIAILVVLSVLATAVILIKLTGFALDRVHGGSSRSVERILASLDRAGTQTAERRLLEEVEKSRSGLKLLEVISTVSPLLGLFGTVLGMIQAFQAMEQAGGRVDPSDLSGGIWVALLTTAAGLAVAMPTSIALSYLDRLVERRALAWDRAIAARLERGGPASVDGLDRPLRLAAE